MTSGDEGGWDADKGTYVLTGHTMLWLSSIFLCHGFFFFFICGEQVNKDEVDGKSVKS